MLAKNAIVNLSACLHCGFLAISNLIETNGILVLQINHTIVGSR